MLHDKLTSLPQSMLLLDKSIFDVGTPCDAGNMLNEHVKQKVFNRDRFSEGLCINNSNSLRRLSRWSKYNPHEDPCERVTWYEIPFSMTIVWWFGALSPTMHTPRSPTSFFSSFLNVFLDWFFLSIYESTRSLTDGCFLLSNTLGSSAGFARSAFGDGTSSEFNSCLIWSTK